MIQNEIPSNHQTPSQSNLEHPNSLLHPGSDASEEDFSEDDQSLDGSSDSSNSSETSEEEGYCTIVYYFDPPKRRSRSKEKRIKARKLELRNLKIQEALNHKQIFDFLPESAGNPFVSLKKLSQLSRPKIQARLTCYVPERNLLLVLSFDYRTVYIYNTIRFNLIAVKKVELAIGILRYSKHLDRILVGGVSCLVQIWNPITFQVEAEFFDGTFVDIQSVEYIPRMNVILVKLPHNIIVYNTSLVWETCFSTPNCYELSHSTTSEFFGLSKDLLLVSCRFEAEKVLVVINMMTRTMKEYKEIFIPPVSCVDLTEKKPTKIFTCLTCENGRYSQTKTDQDPYKLTQFTINKETRELDFYRKTESSHSFVSLQRVENSRYFLAETKENEEVLLSINKDKVEVVKMISKSLCSLRNTLLIKNETCLIELNEENFVAVNRFTIQKEKSKNLVESIEDNDQ